MGNKFEKENFVTTLELLEEKLLQMPEGKKVTVHFSSNMFRIHEEFLPSEIEVNVEDGDITIISCDENSDVDWYFHLDGIIMAAIDSFNNVIEFCYNLPDESGNIVICKMNIAFQF